ncbi:MAG: bifunctional ornithine acetyltransferase/N-acetylglutamate synthase, partial [Bacteroidales bacterium]|nr:bifunctional ornithine acetyltransferase/N-acetylglutamate synthase [Bacteroidales bacterium]
MENPGFEDWPGSVTSEPTGWNSFPSANCGLTGLAAMGCSTATQTKHERTEDNRPGSTGQYSCKIYAKTISIPFIGDITANGALTSGQIQIGSTEASDPSNCNQSLTGNDDFNHPLNAKPDSIVFWAKVVNASSLEDARTLSRAIVGSNLSKAAIFGCDANFGRFLCAMGYSG